MPRQKKQTTVKPTSKKQNEKESDDETPVPDLPPEVLKLIMETLGDLGYFKTLREMMQANHVLYDLGKPIYFCNISFPFAGPFAGRMREGVTPASCVALWEARLEDASFPWNHVKRLDIRIHFVTPYGLPAENRDLVTRLQEIACLVLKGCPNIERLAVQPFVTSNPERWDLVLQLPKLVELTSPSPAQYGHPVALPAGIKHLTVEAADNPWTAVAKWQSFAQQIDNLTTLRSWDLECSVMPRILTMPSAPTARKLRNLKYVEMEQYGDCRSLRDFVVMNPGLQLQEVKVEAQINEYVNPKETYRELLRWNGAARLDLSFLSTDLLAVLGIPTRLVYLRLSRPQLKMTARDLQALRTAIAARPDLKIEMYKPESGRAPERNFWKSLPQVTWIE